MWYNFKNKWFSESNEYVDNLVQKMTLDDFAAMDKDKSLCSIVNKGHFLFRSYASFRDRFKDILCDKNKNVSSKYKNFITIVEDLCKEMGRDSLLELKKKAGESGKDCFKILKDISNFRNLPDEYVSEIEKQYKVIKTADKLEDKDFLMGESKEACDIEI